MKETYNALFDKVASRMSDDELFNRVLSSREGEHIMDNNSENNKKTIKKRGIKMLAAPIAAVVATAGLTVGAFAVYERNISQEYNEVVAPGASIFPQEYKNAEGESAAQPVDNQLYEQMNITIDKTFKRDGVTLEVPGALCDGKDMIVFCNFIFDEEPSSEDVSKCFIGYTPVTEGLKHGTAHYDEGMTNSTRDGKTVFNRFIELSGLEEITADTVKVTLDCLWGDEDLWDNGIYELGFDIEIPLTGDFTQFTKTVDISTKSHVNLSAWGEWDMTDIELTPLSVTFNMHSDGVIPDPSIHKDASPDFPMVVTFKDGSTLDISAHAGMTHGIDPETKTTTIQRSFNFPIKVEDVKSVQFASAVIYMDGTTETVEIPEINDHIAIYDEQK